MNLFHRFKPLLFGGSIPSTHWAIFEKRHIETTGMDYWALIAITQYQWDAERIAKPGHIVTEYKLSRTFRAAPVRLIPIDSDHKDKS